MKHNRRILFTMLFCCLTLVLLTGDALADDVLQTVRNKAAAFIHDLRPLIFILAGFGLIGFAFGAIFGKISWKWFANIAIGLFLVANVGLFIDYFATRSGAAGQYAQALGYGKYLDASGSYTPTEGSSSSPSSQKDPGSNGEDGQKENANSNDINKNCSPGTGVGCSGNTGNQNNTENQNGTGSGIGTENEKTSGEDQTGTETPSLPDELKNAPEMSVDEIAAAMGKTNNSETMGNADIINNDMSSTADNVGNLYDQIINEEAPDEEPLPGTGFENTQNISNNGTPSGEQMNALAQKAKEQYASDGKIDMNQLLRDEVAAGRMTEEEAAKAGYIFTQAANSKGGDVGAAINDVLDSSQKQIETNKAAAGREEEYCKAKGGYWSNNRCLDIINEETPDEAPLPGTGFEQEQAACQAKGGYWSNNRCMDIINEEAPDEASLPGTGFEQEQAACRAKGGYWSNNRCMEIINEETPDEEAVPGSGFMEGELDEVEIVGKDYSDEKRRCTLTGGQWNSSKMSCEYEALNSPINIPGTNQNTSDMPTDEQMNALAQKAKAQYNSTGKINMNQLLREEIASGRMTEEQAARAGYIFTDVANSKGGNVEAAIDEVLRGSKEQMEANQTSASNNVTMPEQPTASNNVTMPEQPAASNNTVDQNVSSEQNEEDEGSGISQYGCQKMGGTWDSATGMCNGVKAPASTSADDEDEYETPSMADDEDTAEDMGISFYGCNKQGGKWVNGECILP